MSVPEDIRSIVEHRVIGRLTELEGATEYSIVSLEEFAPNADILRLEVVLEEFHQSLQQWKQRIKFYSDGRMEETLLEQKVQDADDELRSYSN